MIKVLVRVNELEESIRIDKYLSSVTDYTRNKIDEMFEKGLILVDNKEVKSSFKVKEGNEITLPDDYEAPTDLKGENIPLDIYYEDDDIIVVNKPSGMVVHPGSGNFEHTLVNALIHHTNKLSSMNGEVRPGIVHRIDKDTSGILLIAKNDKAHAILSDGFKNKTIKREYIALLKGNFPNNTATIDAPIGRDKNDRKKMCVTADNSKEAVTHLKVLKRYDGYTLVSLRLETGRTHQIRVHMKYIGFPVVNDPVYLGGKTSEFGQMLHAKSLEFDHPITGKHLYFESPLPKEFENYLKELTETK